MQPGLSQSYLDEYDPAFIAAHFASSHDRHGRMYQALHSLRGSLGLIEASVQKTTPHAMARFSFAFRPEAYTVAEPLERGAEGCLQVGSFSSFGFGAANDQGPKQVGKGFRRGGFLEAKSSHFHRRVVCVQILLLRCPASRSDYRCLNSSLRLLASIRLTLPRTTYFYPLSTDPAIPKHPIPDAIVANMPCAPQSEQCGRN